MPTPLCNLTLCSAVPSHQRRRRLSIGVSSGKFARFRKTRRSCSLAMRAGATVEAEGGISRTALIWRAVKLPMYSVALVPLTVGAAAAYYQTSLFAARRFLVLLGSSVLVIAWLNLSNDVYDFDTGADKNKKESVVNLLGSRSGTFLAACVCLLLGFSGLTLTSLATGNSRAILLLAAAILCGYVYQCPPFRLSYSGLGEPLCFSAFGPFATTAFYFLLGCSSKGRNLPVSRIILLSSFLVGVTTSLILFCSHFHQIEGDVAVGKISPLVRIGTQQGATTVKFALIFLYFILFLSWATQSLPTSCIMLCSLTFPMAILVANYVKENHSNKEKIFMAKYYCVRLHALFGAALASGLVLSKLIS